MIGGIAIAASALYLWTTNKDKDEQEEKDENEDEQEEKKEKGEKERAVVKPIQSVKRLTRKALLIGNNYPKSSCPLNGCINDINDMASHLKSRGWNANEIELKTEATKLATIFSLSSIASQSWIRNLDFVYVHYSGHGTQVADVNGDEAEDGLDEAICPADFQTAGVITDDFMNSLCKMFNPRTKVRFVFDACHSGSCLDLPITHSTSKEKKTATTITKNLKGNITLLSGCMDSQTSADAVYAGRPQGALTAHLLQALKENPDASGLEVLDRVHTLFLNEHSPQYPLLSATEPVGDDAFIV